MSFHFFSSPIGSSKRCKCRSSAAASSARRLLAKLQRRLENSMAWWCYKPKKTVHSPKKHADVSTEKQYPIFKTGRYGMSVPINSILSIIFFILSICENQQSCRVHHGASRSPTFSSSDRSTAISKIFRRAPVGVHRWDLTGSFMAGPV